jgi:hypothetical protein
MVLMVGTTHTIPHFKRRSKVTSHKLKHHSTRVSETWDSLHIHIVNFWGLE